MKRPSTGRGDAVRNQLFNAVAKDRRRRVLNLLMDRTSPVTEEELAIHLAADEGAKSLLDVTEQEVRLLRADLAHVQLPTLEDAGLLDRNTEAETVTTTDHPVLRDPAFERIVETEADRWSDVLANLAHRRRRVALSVLEGEGKPMARADLARSIAVREADEKTDPESVKALYASLHHVHLPKLQQAGLLSYDTDTGTVSFEGHSALDDELLDGGRLEEPLPVLPSSPEVESVWTIEGRKNVIARGQSLFEQAEDELFLMFTTTGLLEGGCLRRLQDAVDRGVDVYLGSQAPDVRDLVRNRVPGVVIWEPQLDWLNLPPDHERVGRLVFADRKAIRLATLGEEIDTDVHTETALTGSGENNPLVMLLRELLGSRLDHLDAQSEDFRSEIPL